MAESCSSANAAGCTKRTALRMANRLVFIRRYEQERGKFVARGMTLNHGMIEKRELAFCEGAGHQGVIPMRILLALLAFVLPLLAQKKDPAMEPITDEPGLPRVLLIGDSISMGYTIPVRKALKGKANIHRILTNGSSTVTGLANLDEWLGKGKWDVIHLNWGLHDLKHYKD